MFPFPSMLSGKQALLVALDPTNIGPSIVLSNGNRTATGGGSVFETAQAFGFKTSGKFYVEVYQDLGGGNGSLGIVKPSHVVSGSLVSATSAACQPIGDAIWIGGVSQGIDLFAGGAAIAGDRLCMAVDLDNNRIWFRKNAEDWNASASANPATNSGGLDIGAWRSGTGVYCAIGGPPSLKATINAGLGQWIGAAPAGFDEVRDY